MAAMVVLAVVAPFALLVRSWRRWQRGHEVRLKIEVSDWPVTAGRPSARIDLTMDAPLAEESEFRRKLTDAVVRVAEVVRRPDDVYHMVARMPSDPDAVVLPVGPQLQELGERFFLVLHQGTLSGRTVVWLTLDRGTALAQAVDPATCDPEGAGEPEGLLGTREARWAMASEWARVGPSLIIRLIVIVPAESSPAVSRCLQSIQAARKR